MTASVYLTGNIYIYIDNYDSKCISNCQYISIYLDNYDSKCISNDLADY